VSSTNNKNLDDIVNNLVNVMTVGTSVSLGAGTLSSILPPSFSKFYRYPGSLTTPGCDESVTWTVFKETIQISELQLQVFRSLTDSHNELLSENHRGVQPINDRVVVANFDPHIHWSYHATSEWSDLYEACSAENQSPINIETNLTQADEKLQVLTFKNYDGSSPVTMKLKNTGHAAQVDFSGAEISVSNGGLPDEYVASQLHFHWGSHDLIGSEHLIDDHSYPMELHIVHYKKSLGSLAAAATEAEGLAVLGIFFQISSNDNPALNSIIQNLGSIQMPDTSVEIPTFSLNSILPANRVDFYRYEGSLTTPRCLESVIWTVFKDSVPISSAQLDKFRNIRSSERDQNGQNIALVDNTRHVQYLNGRVVLRNFNLPPPDNYWSYKGSHGPSSWAHDYPLCGDRYTGRQSPVNIDTTKVLFNVLNSIPLRLDGYNASSGYTLTMRNTGHSVQIDIDGNLRVSRGGLSLTYRATQVHFHWGSDSTRGSEHTIDGRSYPME
ncbi:Carbonic anhydrase 14, partial [Biomphalaria glabrata]